jgi:type IV secretory pathway TrbD component
MRRLLDRPWLRRCAQLFVIVVPLAFLLHNVMDNWQALSEYDWHLDVLRLVGALLTLMLARNLLAAASQQAFSALGYTLGGSTVLRGYHIAALSAYMPGGLYVGRAVVFGKHGVDIISSSAGVLIELSMMVLAGILGSIPYVLFAGLGALPDLGMLILVGALPALSVLRPGVVNRVLRWLLTRLGYSDRAVNLTAGHLFRMLLLGIAYWLVAGFGFCLLVTSVQALRTELLPAILSIYSLAGVVTIVLAVTPGGLGVHEGAVALLLAPLLPTPLPALLAILTRLWTTASRLILFGLAVSLDRGLLPGPGRFPAVSSNRLSDAEPEEWHAGGKKA